MKKFLSIVLSLAMILSFAACEPVSTADPTPTATPTPTETPAQKIDISKLSEYTIVYPADYSEWKMEEVNFFKNVLSNVTKKEVKAIPDSEEVSGKEIILASSSRKTAFDEEIKDFANAMCYVVGVDGDNIVLGGQNFYSDMRAIYDFVNNTLGYDDLKNEYKEPAKALVGEKTVLWEQPEYTIMGSMFSCNPFQNVSQIKDFVDCNFNLAHIFTGSSINSKGTYDNPASVRDQLKWCARFGIQAVIYPKIKTSKTDPDYFDVQISDIEEAEQDVIDCPAVFGLYLIDEPSEAKIKFYQNIVADVKTKYADLDWKIYVNTWTPWYSGIPDEERNVFNELIREYLSDCDAISFDGYCHNYERRNVPYCDILQKVSDLARELDQEFYYFIESYAMNTISDSLKELGAKYLYNYSKGFRTNSYLGLCFGAKMIEYFQYGDASVLYKVEGDWDHGSLINYDFTINHEYYDCAQKVNAEIMFVTDILKNYDYQGVSTENPKYEDIMEIEDSFWSSFIYATVRENSQDSSILMSYYQAKEGNGKAVLLVNLDEFNDVPYEEEVYSNDIQISVNGKNIHFYKDGAEFEPQIVKDGIYSLPFGNGACYLVTMD